MSEGEGSVQSLFWMATVACTVAYQMSQRSGPKNRPPTKPTPTLLAGLFLVVLVVLSQAPVPPTYYNQFGISPSASTSELKKVFREAALAHHPDKKGGDSLIFQELQEVKQTLINETRRALYHRFGPVVTQCSHCNVHIEFLAQDHAFFMQFLISAASSLFFSTIFSRRRASARKYSYYYLAFFAFAVIYASCMQADATADSLLILGTPYFVVIRFLSYAYAVFLPVSLFFAGVSQAEFRTDRELMLAVEANQIAIIQRLDRLEQRRAQRLEEKEKEREKASAEVTETEKENAGGKSADVKEKEKEKERERRK